MVTLHRRGSCEISAQETHYNVRAACTSQRPKKIFQWWVWTKGTGRCSSELSCQARSGIEETSLGWVAGPPWPPHLWGTAAPCPCPCPRRLKAELWGFRMFPWPPAVIVPTETTTDLCSWREVESVTFRSSSSLVQPAGSLHTSFFSNYCPSPPPLHKKIKKYRKIFFIIL